MSKKNSAKTLKAQKEKRDKKEQWIAFGLLFVAGASANIVNGYFAHTKGMYNGWLAVIAPALVLIAIYSVLFPNEFNEQDIRKISFRMWIAIIFAFLVCFANLYAFEHGLY
jgi:uncharacterized membrane protein (GlpM family)